MVNVHCSVDNASDVCGFKTLCSQRSYADNFGGCEIINSLLKTLGYISYNYLI